MAGDSEHHTGTSLGRASLSDRLGIGALLGFFSHKVLSGGPRILLYLAACLVALMLLTKLLPQHMSDRAFGTAYNDIWKGLLGSADTEKSTDDINKSPLVDGLRIVVFGENDIASPRSCSDATTCGLSWTEVLCAELECSDYVSLVPSPDLLVQSMTSNAWYAEAAEEVLKTTRESTAPGLDYSFISETYPARWDIPDLDNQVSAFLSLYKSDPPPRQTLWVFSFGTWDIWSLAAMPFETSKPLLEHIIDEIFTNAETLYQAALDPASIAFSSYSSNFTYSNSSTDNDRDSATASRNTINLTPRLHNKETTEDETATKPFRILIPKLFDPSLTPGWHNLRPRLPSIHSRAEQMRNAVELTEHWNDLIFPRLSAWVKTSDPVDETAPQVAPGHHPSVPAEAPGKFQQFSPLSSGSTQSSPRAVTSGEVPNTVESNDPQRDGILYDLPSYLLDVITDRQMRNDNVSDNLGYGNRSEPDTGFRETWRPCVPPVDPVPVPNAVRPDDYTIGAELNSTDDRAEPRVSSRRGNDEAEADGGSTTTRRQDEQKACTNPDDHLFYTGFTLSQPAIAEIARECADMVRRNETLRGRWAAAQKAQPKKRKGWRA